MEPRNEEAGAAGQTYGERWRAAMAPRTGDVRRELTLEAAEYFGIPVDEAERRISSAGDDFRAEWDRMVSDPSDERQLTRFYAESKAELFEQIAWHASDPIQHRAFVCADLAAAQPGRAFLDYGSGIGSNALIFGLAGFDVTLADIADPLLAFARWRCERRGLRVRAVDLKRETPASSAYDVVTCFDVLEHVPDPLRTLRTLRDALRPGGTFFFYAPIAYDPIRPMHVVHDPAVVRRIRALGFARQADWERRFPAYIRAPSVYVRVRRPAAANAAYYMRDVWLTGRSGAALGRVWRRTHATLRLSDR